MGLFYWKIHQEKVEKKIIMRFKKLSVILLRVQLISNLFYIYHWNFKNASWKKKLDEVNAVF